MIDIHLFERFVPLNALGSRSAETLARRTQSLKLTCGQYRPLAGPERQSLFLVSGEVELHDARRRLIGSLRADSPSAAHALQRGCPQARSLRCLSDVEMLICDAGLLDAVLSWDQGDSLVVGDLSDGGGDADHWMLCLLQNPLFQRVPPTQLQALFMRLQSSDVKAGEVLIRQGDSGDTFYVLVAGCCSVVRQEPGATTLHLGNLEGVCCFGEEALITELPRNATVAMLTAGRVLRLGKQDFHELLKDPVEQRISHADARQRIAGGRARWLDVRLTSELGTGAERDAMNIPLHQLRARMSALSRANDWIVCCDTGRRSAIGAFLLLQHGYEAYVLDGGLCRGR